MDSMQQLDTTADEKRGFISKLNHHDKFNSIAINIGYIFRDKKVFLFLSSLKVHA